MRIFGHPFFHRSLAIFIFASLGLAAFMAQADEPSSGNPELDKIKRATLETISTLQAVTSATVAPISPNQASEVLIYALSMVGVKYRYGGNSAVTGFDCSGFVHHVFAEIAAYTLPRRSEAIALQGTKVAIADLVAGDLVFYNTRSRLNSHVGIYLGNNTFVHAPSRGKSVEIVDMKLLYWQKRFNGARRLLAGSVTTSEPVDNTVSENWVSSVANRDADGKLASKKNKEPDAMPITNGQ